MYLISWIMFLSSSQIDMYTSRRIIHKEGFITQIMLYDNGTVIDPLSLPYCDIGQKISLLWHSSTTKTCKETCLYNKKPLSPDVEMLLFDRCSLKQICDNLSFYPLNDNLFYIVVGYKCLINVTFYNLCDYSEEMTTGGVAQLIAEGEGRNYASCKCVLNAVKYDLFNVTLKDIRLYTVDKSERKCTNTVLQMDATTYACSETSLTYGATFNLKLVEREIQNISLTINLDTHDHLFQMIWITVSSMNPFMIKCNEIKTSNDKAISMQTTTTNHLLTEDVSASNTHSFTTNGASSNSKPTYAATSGQQTITRFMSYSDNQSFTTYGSPSNGIIKSDSEQVISTKTIIIAVSAGCVSAAATAVMMLIFYKRRESANDYIEPVYKRTAASNASFTHIPGQLNTIHQQHCGSPRVHERRGFEETESVPQNVTEAYYLEITASIYHYDGADEINPDTYAVIYEQLHENVVETESEYTILDPENRDTNTS